MGAQAQPRALPCKQPALLACGVALVVLMIMMIARQVRSGRLPDSVISGETKRQRCSAAAHTSLTLSLPVLHDQ